MSCWRRSGPEQSSGDRPANGLHRQQGRLAIVRVLVHFAVEAREIVDRVINGNAQHHGGNQAGARVQTDTEKAQRAEIDGHRQDIRQQGHKTDALGHEHDSQDQVDEDQRQADAARLADNDVREGFTDQDRVARDRCLDMFR